ncbi:Fc.00g082740.m01.CDS01 [Cosmosporella sp. VM-42]
MKHLTRNSIPGRLLAATSRHFSASANFSLTSATAGYTITSDTATSSVDTSTKPTTRRQPSTNRDSALAKEKKTLAELDEELRAKMESMSGEGGASGVEYENGKAEGLKRGVKSNMFRVI